MVLGGTACWPTVAEGDPDSVTEDSRKVARLVVRRGGKVALAVGHRVVVASVPRLGAEVEGPVLGVEAEESEVGRLTE